MKIRRINAGEKIESGKYVCDKCGAEITVADGDELPACPRCEGKSFKEGR